MIGKVERKQTMLPILHRNPPGEDPQIYRTTSLSSTVAKSSAKRRKKDPAHPEAMRFSALVGILFLGTKLLEKMQAFEAMNRCQESLVNQIILQ